MVLGITYTQALEFTRKTEEDVGYSGMTHYFFDQVVALHGYAVQRRFRKNILTDTDHVVWPPEPWSEIHYCSVNTMIGAPIGHSVIMLSDGTVLDPARDTTRKLTDYVEVYSVAAVYKINLMTL